ncbi:MAG: type II toxin-antitoxin system HicB family antitoxin [Armatimonadota bacterium]
MRDQYIYPAVFDPAEEGGYTVTFPDLPGCITEGDTEEEAFARATDALELHLFSMEQDHDDIPVPSAIRDIALEPGQVLMLVRANMLLTRNKMWERAVRKMVTIPRWLNDLAEAEAVNFSQVLQHGLKAVLNVQAPEDAASRRGRQRKSA